MKVMAIIFKHYCRYTPFYNWSIHTGNLKNIKYAIKNTKNVSDDLIVHWVKILVVFHLFGKSQNLIPNIRNFPFICMKESNPQTDHFPLNHENWYPRIKVLSQ